MVPAASEWTTLEIAKLVASVVAGVATPAVLGVVGWKIQQRLKEIDQRLWTSQKVVETRLERFEVVGPLLNDLYCYFLWFGRWKETTPLDVVATKRALDREMHVHRFLFSEGLWGAYDAFLETCFDTDEFVGEDARLKTAVVSFDGDDRRTALRASRRIRWKREWDDRFVYVREPEPEPWDEERLGIRRPVRDTYLALMAWFSADVGLVRGNQPGDRAGTAAHNAGTTRRDNGADPS